MMLQVQVQGSNSQEYHNSLLERKRGSKLYVYHFCQSFLIVLERVLRDESEYDLIYVSNWREWNGRDGHAYPRSVWECEQTLFGCKWERYIVTCSDFYIFTWQPREWVVCSWQPTSIQVVACRTLQTRLWNKSVMFTEKMWKTSELNYKKKSDVWTSSKHNDWSRSWWQI